MAPAAPETGRIEEPERDPSCRGVQVRVATPETAAKAGIETETVQEAAVDLAVTAPARPVFDPTRAARVSSPVAGVVREVLVVAGSRVRSGQALVVLASAATAEAAAGPVPVELEAPHPRPRPTGAGRPARPRSWPKWSWSRPSASSSARTWTHCQARRSASHVAKLLRTDMDTLAAVRMRRSGGCGRCS
jgi:hypothetical protein